MPSTELQCLEHGPQCEGDVECRMPLSGTGRPFPRCEFHWDKRLDEQERINERLPDSPVAPAWYDEAAIGEHWDADY